MKVSVDFQDERQEFEIDDDKLVAAWTGPAGAVGTDCVRLINESLENPRDYPPLRQAVVPGDRVVIAWDASIAEAGPVVEALCPIIAAAGVEAGDLTFLTSAEGREGLEKVLPAGAKVVVHDPDDRAEMAYLATTKNERRVYLNRLLTDADLVVPVGRLGFDSVLGYHGPWSVLFPMFSDRATIRASREIVRDDTAPPSLESPNSWLTESFEVSWLLGSQFHVGIVPGSSGLVEVITGLESSVRRDGIGAIDRVWKFAADSQADLVVIGVGRGGIKTSLDDLAEGLAAAARLVQHGGKIVILSHAAGDIGPALGRLMEVDDSKTAAAALRGHEGHFDFVAARRLAHALSRADVFLLSDLPRSVVEDLSMMALENPRQVQKLVSQSASCLFLSHADLTWATVRREKKS